LNQQTEKSEKPAFSDLPKADSQSATGITHSGPGRVVLVGAGPGDPGLITVAGLKALEQADVVVFDALANPVLLAKARADAELIDCGKRAKAHKLTQDQTNALLVEKAQAGALVVRLKGGDPYLFGRGAEEASYCATQGVGCQVIPGITAGVAAPAMAGIPVTHRKIASTVTIVTGHEDPTKDDTSIDYAALAGLIKSGGTACFYMGVGRLESICRELMGHGLASDTPAALVQWGTLPKQRHVRGTLANIKQRVDDAGIGSPAIIVVGQVAAIQEPGLDFFTARPLFGQRIVVTRTRQQVSELREHLEALGAQVLEAPTIQIVKPADTAAFDDAVANLADYDALVLTSGNAVDALAARLAAQGLDSRALAGVYIACIGRACAERLSESLAIAADFIPQRAISESLAEGLLEAADLAGKRVLLPTADIARPALPERLRAGGARVDEFAVYQTARVDELAPEVAEALQDEAVDWVTFTSSSTASNLVQLLGPDVTRLSGCRLASIGPKTSGTMRELGIAPTIEAATHDIAGLVAALVQASK